jgi:hypothetical protein
LFIVAYEEDGAVINIVRHYLKGFRGNSKVHSLNARGISTGRRKSYYKPIYSRRELAMEIPKIRAMSAQQAFESDMGIEPIPDIPSPVGEEDTARAIFSQREPLSKPKPEEPSSSLFFTQPPPTPPQIGEL